MPKVVPQSAKGVSYPPHCSRSASFTLSEDATSLDWAVKQEDAYIVLCQVGVVLLDAVVQNRNHHPLPGEAQLPGALHVQVAVVGVVLKTRLEQDIPSLKHS